MTDPRSHYALRRRRSLRTTPTVAIVFISQGPWQVARVKSTITEGVLFHSAALGETRWTVRSLEGVDALNQEYSFRVRLDLATGTLTQEDLERVLEAPATLVFIEGELELNRFSGVVESLTSRPDLDRKRTDLDVTLVPRVALAAHRRGSELFLDRTIPEVLFEKLTAWGLRADEDFISLLRSKYFRREIVAQHEESDLTFFRRLCEGSGITASYEERGGREVLVLSDGNTPFEDIGRPRLHARRRAGALADQIACRAFVAYEDP